MAQLDERRGIDAAARAEAANFEEWCLELMGPILYERYIKPYHREAVGAACAYAVGAVGATARIGALGQRSVPVSGSVPGLAGRAHGYTDLIDGLLRPAGIEVQTGVDDRPRQRPGAPCGESGQT